MKKPTRIPKELLSSEYRRTLWKQTQRILKKVDLPISRLHVMGSFVTKKRRPADVDFIVLLRTPEKNKKAEWSVDFVIAPDNAYGRRVEKDAKLWVEQKYGKTKSRVTRLV